MTTNIQISKGGVSATIQTHEINDNYKNQINTLVLPTTKQKQDAGPKTNKVIDLLKITHTLMVRGSLIDATTRNNLITIHKGANVTGQPCSVIYDSHPNTPLSMYMTDLTIVEKADDRKGANITGGKIYEVSLTLIEGS